MKIGFFGTPELSAAVLADCLKAADVEVAYVVSQPDRPVGRHAVLTASPVSQLALDRKIPLFRPERLRENSDFLAEIRKYEVDFLVVVAYGRILPTEILSLPKALPINIHGSLLPKYRGASPIQSALLNGESETGVTIMEMTPGMDEGGMLETTVIPIAPGETSDSLFQKFCEISGTALLKALRKYLRNEIAAIEQNHSLATYTKKWNKEDGQVFWSEKSAQEIYRLWQACTSWPGAWTLLDGKRCKIVDCQVIDFDPIAPDVLPGTFWKSGNRLFVAAKKGTLELGEIVIEGKSKRKAADVLDS